MTYRLEPASRLLVGLVVIVFLLGAFFLTRPPSTVPHQPLTIPTPSESSTPLAKELDYSLREEQIEEHDPVLPYHLDVTYPVFQADEVATNKINASVENWVRARIAAFLEEATKHPSFEDELFGKSSYRLRYTTSLFTESEQSTIAHIIFIETPFFAGAAHPGLQQKVFLFDLQNGTELRLETFLKTDTTSLGTLRTLLVDALAKRQANESEEPNVFTQKEQRIEWDDALRQRENLENISLTTEGIVFTFDPYVVGSYAEGVQEILLPAHELDAKGLLTERGERIFPSIVKPARFLKKQP